MVNTLMPNPSFEANSFHRIDDGLMVAEITEAVTPLAYSKTTHYKICLLVGKYKMHYGYREVVTEGTMLFFGRPGISYRWESLGGDHKAFACTFTEDYLSHSDRGLPMQKFPFFRTEGMPLFHLTSATSAFVEVIFRKLLAQQEMDYVHRDELIWNYIKLIFHETMQLQPARNYASTFLLRASSRIAGQFLELLERQFPVDSIDQRLQLRNASAFAQHLSIHVNHLNHAVREATGKSTTKHISDRVAIEAKSLLKNTDWSIAEISYSLGFEYPTHFTNYFRRMTGIPPRAVRGNPNVNQLSV